MPLFGSSFLNIFMGFIIRMVISNETLFSAFFAAINALIALTDKFIVADFTNSSYRHSMSMICLTASA